MDSCFLSLPQSAELTLVHPNCWHLCGSYVPRASSALWGRERKQESICHQPPTPKEKAPKSSQRQWLILNIWEGGSFQGSHGSVKRPKPQGQERCCELNCIPLNSYVEVLILSVLVFGDGHPKHWPTPSPLS